MSLDLKSLTHKKLRIKIKINANTDIIEKGIPQRISGSQSNLTESMLSRAVKTKARVHFRLTCHIVNGK